ncbi:MAG: CoA activase, partial [Spirochaetota bacterium]
AVLWVGAGMWPCNLPLYPHHIKTIMERRGGGMERIDVFNCDITFLAFCPRATIGAFHAFLAGGTLRKVTCRSRPYEKEAGSVDALAGKALALLVEGLEGGSNMEGAYRAAFHPFLKLPVGARDRPKVAIFGDLYSRDNDVLNQGLEKAIEAAGGEVITTSYIEYLKGVMDPHFRKLLLDRRYGAWAKDRAAMAVVAAVEKALSIRDGDIFGRPSSWSNPGYADKLRLFGLRVENEGECFDNVLKIFRILEEHPDVALFVQANPAFCCPSLVTESMSAEIERITGVPVVTITYDGTGAPKNDAIEPYLAFGRGRASHRAPAPP